MREVEKLKIQIESLNADLIESRALQSETSAFNLYRDEKAKWMKEKDEAVKEI